MNIAIVTHYFPPLNAVASLRLYAFAQYMAEFGHDVSVITTAKNRKDGTLDLCFNKHPLYKLYELDYIPRYLRLAWNGNKPCSQSIAAKNAKATLSGKMRSMIGTVRAEYFGTFLEFRDLWVKKAVNLYGELARHKHYDVIISSFSPTSPQYVGYLVKKAQPDIIWVADYRDLWSTSPFEKAKFPVNHIQKTVEKKIMVLADIVTTVSEPLRNDLQSLFNKPTYVIENGYFPEDEYVSTVDDSLFGDRQVISYTGSIHKNRRDPFQFFVALKEMIESRQINPEKLEVHFYGSNTYTLQNVVDEMKLNAIVRLNGQVSYEKAIQIQRSSKALLFLEMNESSAKGVLTGKIFEYIVSKRPIISVGPTPDHETGKLINETNTGFVCGFDKSLIKMAIKQVFEGRPLKPDFDKIESYRRDRTTSKLLTIIEEARNRN